MNHINIDEMVDKECQDIMSSKQDCLNLDNDIKCCDSNISSFNDSLRMIIDISNRQYNGELDKTDVVNSTIPYVTKLIELCKSCNIPISSNVDINEEEIGMLRNYLIKRKTMLKEMRDMTKKTYVTDDGVLEETVDITAMEFFGSVNYVKEVMRSKDSKLAAEYKAQAKKLYGMGNKEKAKEYLEKAIDLYEKCVEDTNKRVKRYDETQKYERGIGPVKYTSVSTKSVTDSRLSKALDFFEKKIDECKALMLQWENKAGNVELAETRKRLTEEREVSERKEAKSGMECYKSILAIESL